jgi:hypothetical protein
MKTATAISMPMLARVQRMGMHCDPNNDFVALCTAQVRFNLPCNANLGVNLSSEVSMKNNTR